MGWRVRVKCNTVKEWKAARRDLALSCHSIHELDMKSLVCGRRVLCRSTNCKAVSGGRPAEIAQSLSSLRSQMSPPRSRFATRSTLIMMRGERNLAITNSVAGVLTRRTLMADDKSKQDNRDRSRINSSEPYEVEDFHRKHPHLTREQAVEIIKNEGGNRERADAAAERLKGR